MTVPFLRVLAASSLVYAASSHGTGMGSASTSASMAEADPQSVLRLAYAHGWLMTLSLGILVPTSVFFARFAKRDGRSWWYNVHRGLMSLSVVMAACALVLVWFHVHKEGGKHYQCNSEDSGSHGAKGLALALLFFVNFVLGAVSPPKPAKGAKRTRKRLAFEVAHRAMGVAIVVWAVPQIFSGIALFEGFRNYAYAYTAFVLAFVVLAVVLQFRACYASDAKILAALAAHEASQALAPSEVGAGKITPSASDGTELESGGCTRTNLESYGFRSRKEECQTPCECGLAAGGERKV